MGFKLRNVAPHIAGNNFTHTLETGYLWGEIAKLLQKYNLNYNKNQWEKARANSIYKEIQEIYVFSSWP